MDIFELIKTRRSIRKYKTNPVPRDLIEKVVIAGILAPSSMNRQPWRFVVVANEEKRIFFSREAKKTLGEFLQSEEGVKRWGEDAAKRFLARAESDEDTIFYDAPVIIFIIRTLDVGNQFDYGLAAQNMMLCAHGNDLATCPIGLAKYLENSDAARTELNMKPDEQLILALCLGYPDEEGHDKGRDFEVVDFLE